MVTSFREFSAGHNPGLMLFTQHFPKEIGPDAYTVTAAEARSARSDADFSQCRISTEEEFELVADGHYNAHVGGTVLQGKVCGDGSGGHADVAHSTDGVSLDYCAGKCAELDCTCFDYAEQPPVGGGVGSDHKLSSRTLFPAFKR